MRLCWELRPRRIGPADWLPRAFGPQSVKPIPANGIIAIKPRSHARTFADRGRVNMISNFSGDTALAHQPDVDKPASPRLKIQKPGLRILEFVEELQRLPAARAAWIDGLSCADPTREQSADLLLHIHSTRSVFKTRSARIGTVGAIDCKIV